MGFSNWIRRLPENVDYRIFMYTLPIPIITFYALALTGCVSMSPGIPSVFTLKLRNNQNDEVRIGYYAICIFVANVSACQTTTGKNAENILQSLGGIAADNQDARTRMTEIVEIALKLQSTYIIGTLAVGGALFFIGLVFIALLKLESKIQEGKNRSRLIRQLLRLVRSSRSRLRKASVSAVWTSAAFAFVSATSFEQAANALTFISKADPLASRIMIETGRTLSILQWLTLGLSFIFGVGISSMFARGRGSIGSNKVSDYPLPPPSSSGLEPPPPLGLPPLPPPGIPPPPPPPIY